MKLRNYGLVLEILFCAILTSNNLGCGRSSASSPPPPAISVSVSPSSATVQANTTQNFTATVTNDAGNKGVAWTISCSAASCGSVSPTSTPSGAPTTYTAPATLSSTEDVTITATSVALSSASAEASVILPPSSPIQISISEDASSVNPGGTVHFYGSVLNDPTNSGLRWSLTCTPVQSSCGSVSPTTTQSGSPTTYTAPSTVPLAGLSVTFTATAVVDTSISNSGTIPVLGVTVAVSPATATVDFSGTQLLTATVANDPKNSGVAWTVACSSAPCGTFSSLTTASGAPTTYNAPATPPASDLSISVTATSITYNGASASATVKIPAITVSSSPATALIPLKANQRYIANVGYDSNQEGVSWSLSQNGSACSPACGTLTPANTPSGSATTYTAPPAMPPAPTVTITATSNSDGTKSSTDTLTLSNGTVELVPYSLDFGRVLVGASGSLTVTFTNTGGAALSISAVVATDVSEFSQNNACNSSVSAGGSCAITATFAPTKVGTVTGSIVITDSSSDSPQQVNMAGTGYTRGAANSAALRTALGNTGIVAAPMPTGAEKVGTRVLHLVDPTRFDPFLHNGTRRELMIRFWYPASLPDACQRAEYASPGVWNYFGQLLGMRLPQVLSNSCQNAPVKEGAHPTVVFTHGYTGTFTDHTFIFEDLASRGYVVASVDHTYEATAVEFPGGVLVKSKLGSHLASTWRGDEKTLAFATSVRLDDLKFLLNQLERLNGDPDSAFSGKLDLLRIAIAGHSMGGATALLTLQMDERFKAAVILDGVIPPSLIRPTQSPVMILNSSRPKTSTDQCLLWKSLRGPRLYLSLDGAEHLTPSDALWLAPGAIAAGAMGAERTVVVIRDSVAAFLDANLRERSQYPLPSTPSLNKLDVTQSPGDQLTCLP